MTNVPAPRILVVTERPYFADAAARHLVAVGAHEEERRRLFFRDEPRRDRTARHQDVAGDGPGRYFDAAALADHERDVALGHAEPLAEHRHASFAAFLQAIGYDWSANAYAPRPAAG